MNNVTGPFVAVVLLLVLLIRRPSLVLLGPLSLVVLWDYGSMGLVLLWVFALLLHHVREHRSAQLARQ